MRRTTHRKAAQQSIQDSRAIFWGLFSHGRPTDANLRTHASKINDAAQHIVADMHKVPDRNSVRALGLLSEALCAVAYAASYRTAKLRNEHADAAREIITGHPLMDFDWD